MGKNKHSLQPKKPKIIPITMDATFFFERAVISLDRFHYEKALKYFRRAVEYEPNNPVNHCNLAGVLSEMGNYSESNQILQYIVEHIDPAMTECHFYMANNYANMDNFEAAEEVLIRYLEHDETGQFLEESEEMMDLLSYELERPTKLKSIKCREGMFEHDQARALLEDGKFLEAIQMLEQLSANQPNFMAARNNLALGYYYMGQFDKSIQTIQVVLEQEPGNIHALCNMAIFYHHFGNRTELEPLLEMLRKTVPFHQEHAFKLATTLGILGEHHPAYCLFKRLLKGGEAGMDPCLYHYAAVAAFQTNRYKEAYRLWKQAEKLDPKSDIPKFYLSQLHEGHLERGKTGVSYHYHLPFEEQFRLFDLNGEGIPDHLKCDPLVRSSFFWALRHGDLDTKLQVIQAFGTIADREVEDALRKFLLDPHEDDYLKKVAVFVLRSMQIKEPLQVWINGKQTVLKSEPLSPNLPVWRERWQLVMDQALAHMEKRYDIIQQHDLETLWVEFLTRVYPDEPKITKTEGWSAALEYLTAKMHRRAITYHEVAVRYGVSITTISKNVKVIDEVCGLREKMNAIFPKLSASDQF